LPCHPFHYTDFKEQAYICKQPANKSADWLKDCGTEFFMDFGFMRASTSNYRRPNKDSDRVILSYDGYTLYLLIVDGGGIVQTDQGGELARSDNFINMLESEFHYVVKPTGSDRPSQNGAAEIYNAVLAVKAQTLLYQSRLPAKFWSAAATNLMCTTKPAYSSGTRPPTKISDTWTPNQASSKQAIMPRLMRHGISNRNDHQQRSSYTTWDSKTIHPTTQTEMQCSNYPLAAHGISHFQQREMVYPTSPTILSAPTPRICHQSTNSSCG
jgi:hypothetical protein